MAGGTVMVTVVLVMTLVTTLAAGWVAMWPAVLVKTLCSAGVDVVCLRCLQDTSEVRQAKTMKTIFMMAVSDSRRSGKSM